MEISVLIADDDEISLLMLTMVAKSSGISANPMTFLNGKELLDYILEHHDQQKKTLILLDINMPVMNAWEFLDSLSNSGKYTNIVVSIVTSSTNKSDKEKAATYSRVKGFLEKPVKVSDMKKLNELFS